jgi:hypothetical protein
MRRATVTIYEINKCKVGVMSFLGKTKWGIGNLSSASTLSFD